METLLEKTQEHWIRIENRKSWLVDKIEVINPADEFKYISYWSDQKRKCIEGLWNKDFEQKLKKSDKTWKALIDSSYSKDIELLNKIYSSVKNRKCKLVDEEQP